MLLNHFLIDFVKKIFEVKLIKSFYEKEWGVREKSHFSDMVLDIKHPILSE